MDNRPAEKEVAEQLAQLYERQFGGKPRGRYRISMKHMRLLTGRRRVSPRCLRKISEELFELGYVLIDLESFFVVLAQRTFTSYRAGQRRLRGTDDDRRRPRLMADVLPVSRAGRDELCR